MNKKTFRYSPVAIAIMSTCFNVSAQTIATDQTTPVNSTPATDIIVDDNVALNVIGSPAVTIDDPMITLTVESGSSITSDPVSYTHLTLPTIYAV